MANPQTFSLRPKISLILNHSVSGSTVNWNITIYETESQPSFSNILANNTVSWNFSAGGGPSGSKNFTYTFEPAGLQTIVLESGSFNATASFFVATASVSSPTTIGSASVDQAISPSLPPPPPPPTPVWSTTSPLPTATRGSAYSATVTASPVTSYSLVSSSGATGGLSFSGNTISGTPTTVGTATFTIRANNSGSTADRTFEIPINPALPVFSDSTVDPSARVGIAYSDGVAASETASYSVFSGALPAGLSLNTSTGAITGTPTTPGTSTFVIRATNVTGNTDTGTLTITVISAARVWNGTEFVSGLANVWNGTTFVSGILKVWDGTNWVNAN